MIKKIYFFFLIFFLTSNQTTIASIESSIVVKVDSQIITNIEIKDKILRTLILTNQEINQKNINNLKKIIKSKKKIYIYGIAENEDERAEVINEAKQILDVEDVIPSILLVEDLRVIKN